MPHALSFESCYEPESHCCPACGNEFGTSVGRIKISIDGNPFYVSCEASEQCLICETRFVGVRVEGYASRGALEDRRLAISLMPEEQMFKEIPLISIERSGIAGRQ